MSEKLQYIWVSKEPLETPDYESILICKKLNGAFHAVMGTLHPDKDTDLTNWRKIKAIKQNVENFVREIFVELEE